MNIKPSKKAGVLVAAAIASALAASTAQASHFRGAALVPSVDANGVLTINSKSFWRKGTASGGVGSFVNVSGVGSAGEVSSVVDTSDVRRDSNTEVFQTTLPGAGYYTITWGSCCWVRPGPSQNFTESSYSTVSTIYWDGSNATNPIQFDLENIQQQVVGGQAYSDNLDAVGSSTLSYDTSYIAQSMTMQAEGFTIDATGQINIDATSTGNYVDNPFNDGADEAFSARITASDGVNPNEDSSVEFVWLFDVVDSQSANLAPEITDVTINALIGDSISQVLTVTDPNAGDVVTTNFLSFIGSSGAVAGSTFDPNTLQFNWDSTGFSAGQYVATFRAADGGGLTDQGTITINLRAPSNPNVTEPGSLAIAAAGLLTLGALRRRRK
ncbi:Ig domain-containing protein [Alteromonas sp. ASW11-36]|uniref:Ig domain-containing protein n=1 Tax=Alteromonas arenosi TaxID=3055817 RepID=A0ABT7T1F4_9ALTE|nr:Ig domain-containing protein [Alteromonas sp. ASW11-36]MDM7862273.1 Ig domain-containing protein [Alteromonas sp. ASW11-36]